ncbi:hypothetical protein M8J77_014177 [Diaphorina citri]|nr:hypothetical protein M8J77_014177 [Diaphorina citri]
MDRPSEPVSNERVLEMVGERRMIWKALQQRRHKWIGHIYRHNQFLVDIIEGRREGGQRRGRPRMKYRYGPNHGICWQPKLHRDEEMNCRQKQMEKCCKPI